MNGQPNPITRKRVYELIYKTQRISKQDIAYQLTLSLPTVSQQLQSLEASGLIERNGSFASTGGRKAQIISCIYDARISIGIEIRLNTLSMAAIDLRGTLLHTIQYAVPFSNTPDYFELLGEKLTHFLTSLAYPSSSILGIGIVLQGLISADGKTVTYGKILNCTGLTVRAISKYLPFPCTMIHDAEAAATLELWQQPEKKNAIFFHIRENLSGALIVNGKFLKGCELTLEDFFLHLRKKEHSYEERWLSYLSALTIAIDNLHMVIDYDVILGGSIAPYITDNDIDLLLSKIQKASAFPTDRHFISAASCAGIPIACGAALPYIRKFLESLD